MVSGRVRLALQAMRYYRLWIYATNAVLVLSVVVFVCVAAALLADPRRTLVSSTVLSLQQPSLVLVYAGLVVQGIVLPLIGCLGAVRLSERLLQAYWMLLLILLGGDLLMGIIWILRFQKALTGVIPDLKVRLGTDYGRDADFSQAWDLVQRSARCCGVQSPSDFNQTFWEQSLRSWESNPSHIPLPDTCCKALGAPADHPSWSWVSQQVPPGRKEVYGTGKHRTHLREHREQHATTSTTTTTPPPPPPVMAAEAATFQVIPHHTVPESPIKVNGSVCWKVWPALESDIHDSGCGQLILDWVQHTGEVLFILGYCVLMFVKLCFAAILRYELREMIHKIKILKGEIASQEVNNIFGQSAAAVPRSGSGMPVRSPPAVIAVDSEPAAEETQQLLGNGEVPLPLTTTNEEEAEEMESPTERCSLLGNKNLLSAGVGTTTNTSSPGSAAHLSRFAEAANDSDTGSSCALLSERPLTTAKDRFFNRCERDRLIKEWDRSYENGWSNNGRTNGNNNEYHELREIKQTQI